MRAVFDARWNTDIECTPRWQKDPNVRASCRSRQHSDSCNYVLAALGFGVVRSLGLRVFLAIIPPEKVYCYFITGPVNVNTKILVDVPYTDINNSRFGMSANHIWVSYISPTYAVVERWCYS